jgi:hypothetical protein
MTDSNTPVVVFDAGIAQLSVFLTRGVVERINKEDYCHALRRHIVGDWGEVSLEDWKSNDEALRDGSRLLSVYFDRHSNKFWIITEADRSATTILLPEEY